MRYPKALWWADGVSGGVPIDVPRKVVLHTTETVGLPDYKAGTTAPHLTYDPKTRQWYQHTDFDFAARALRNLSGGVETNRANAWQVEIICYSASGIAAGSPSRLWVGDLPATAYEDLRDFIAWASVPSVWPGRQALSYSQANAPGFRLTGAQWLDFNGVLGHQHVPENDHWDPGALDWSQIIRSGEEALLPLNPASATEDIRLLQDRLNEAYGLKITVNGKWGADTAKAVQERLLKFTGSKDPDALAGKSVNANMFNGLTKEWVLSFAGGGDVGGLKRGDTVRLE